MTTADKSEPPGKPPKGPEGPSPSEGGSGGYFTIYKKGQGYWTRMGTVSAVSLIGIAFAHFLYEERLFFNLSEMQIYGVIAVLGALYAGFAYHMLNKPSNVDFLISTDSEMKRVNWTSQKDLVGSTRVVIAFVFIMACVLFIYDLFFQTVFYLVGVLKTPPPFFPVKH
ncbi:MAG: preprotein translocase subunit SecE [Tepidisphaeraceae bacterium]|jgi:preprotein translocase subunit SecE